MIRHLLTAGAVAVAFTAAAFAEGPAGQVFEVSTPAGTATVSFSAGGTYTIDTDEGSGTGTWSYGGGELCVDSGEGEVCGSWSGLGVGESTVSTDFSQDGSAQTITRIE